MMVGEIINETGREDKEFLEKLKDLMGEYKVYRIKVKEVKK